MINLAFEVWDCSVPAGGSGAARLNIDPSITCTIGREYVPTAVGSVFPYFLFIAWLVGAGLAFISCIGLLRSNGGICACLGSIGVPASDPLCACIGSIIFIVGAVGLIATSVWGSLLVGSVIAFLMFGIAFPALSLSILNRGAAEGRLDEDEFQVQSDIGVLLLLLLLLH